MDKFERLHMLLNLAEKLMGHPKYAAINSHVADEIDKTVDEIKDKPVAPTPAPVPPVDPELPLEPKPAEAKAIPTRRVWDGMPGPAEAQE